MTSAAGRRRTRPRPARRCRRRRRRRGSTASSRGEWTSSTMRVSTSGSVSGGTPWPRLKMCPSAARPCVDDAAHRALDHRPAGASSAGSRLPCTTAPGPSRRAASSSGTRQSTPTTSAPAARIAGSSSPVPTPKWMRGTRAGQRLEHRAAVRQHELARSRRATAHRPTSRTAGPPRRPASICTRRNSRAIDGQPAEQRVPQLRVAVHQRLGPGVVPRRAALDQVAGQRERRAGEADQRRRRRARRRAARTAAVTYGTSPASSGAQRVQVGGGRGSARRPPGRRPATMSMPTPMATSGTTMSENRIAASTPWRRTGCRVISVIRSGVAAGVEHRGAGPQRAVLRQRAAGLAHEPHRRVRAGTAASRRGRAGTRLTSLSIVARVVRRACRDRRRRRATSPLSASCCGARGEGAHVMANELAGPVLPHLPRECSPRRPPCPDGHGERAPSAPASSAAPRCCSTPAVRRSRPCRSADPQRPGRAVA